MIVTRENYFSKEANMRYMGSTQFKNFMKCESMAMATLEEAWKTDPEAWAPEEKDCFLEGHYMHAWNEGKLNEFKATHPEIYSSQGPTKGQLKSTFKHLEEMIKVAENDEFFMLSLEGQKEYILTVEMFGAEWKVMIDSYLPEKGRFTDLKAIKALNGTEWLDGIRLNVVDYYEYPLQQAIYAEAERRKNNRSYHLQPHIAIIDKRKRHPRKQVYTFTSDDYPIDIFVDKHMMRVEQNMPRIIAVKSGKEKPRRCESEDCDYCIATKVLTGTTFYKDFDFDVD